MGFEACSKEATPHECADGTGTSYEQPPGCKDNDDKWVYERGSMIPKAGA